MPVLQIRDKDGNFIPIPAITGEKGKSAYEQAKEGGYAGTKEEFIAILNSLTYSEDTEHRADFDNPHLVSCSQINAAQSEHQHSTNDLISGVLDVSRGGTGATTAEEALTNLGGAKIQTGSYVGTGTYGEDNPTLIHLDGKPKVVIMTNYYQTPCHYTLGDIIPINWLPVNKFVTAAGKNISTGTEYTEVVFDYSENILSFMNENRADVQYNELNTVYHYIAIF